MNETALCRCGRPLYQSTSAGMSLCPGCEYMDAATCDCAPAAPTLKLDTVCQTCHCQRRWHYQTYAGGAGCTREVGKTNPVPCACTGFMLTEAADLRRIHEEQMAALIWRAAKRRQDAIDATKYHSIGPGIETKDELAEVEVEFQAWLDGDVGIAYLSRPPFLGGWKAGRRYEKQLQSALARHDRPEGSDGD